MTLPLEITVTHDFICPWCLVGEVRLRRAIEALPDPLVVRVRYRAFELNPDMPPEGMDRRAYRTAKFGSWEHSQALDQKTVLATRSDGIAFDYERIERTPNTRRAHRLMVLAEREGHAEELSHALFRSYFEQGRDIGDRDVLIAIAAEVGLGPDEAARFAGDGDEGLAEVLFAEQDARNLGVASVPTIEIGEAVVSGAQPMPVFAAALRRALADPALSAA